MIHPQTLAKCLAILATFVLPGCANIDVTKTAKGTFPATDANEVEVLSSFPKSRPYTEIATISTNNWSPSETAKMHNALRAQAAPLGADAVVLLNSGIDQRGYLWSTGAAVRYTDRR